MVAVTHGHVITIALIKKYLERDPMTGLNLATREELEKLAWDGATTKEWIMKVPKKKKVEKKMKTKAKEN